MKGGKEEEEEGEEGGREYGPSGEGGGNIFFKNDYNLFE